MSRSIPLHYWSLVALLLVTALFQMLHESGCCLLQYRRELFVDRFYTQWITPSLVHINWMHWMLNILNLIALVVIFSKELAGRVFLLIFALSSLFIMLCLYLFSKDVLYYAGMSGVLYGIALYAGLKALWIRHRALIASVILLYLTAKLVAHDQINAVMGVDKALEGMRVVTDVHWYGAIIGFLIFLSEFVKKRYR